eukprot:351346-Chlamydomonas_euryale.AAC.5
MEALTVLPGGKVLDRMKEINHHSSRQAKTDASPNTHTNAIVGVNSPVSAPVRFRLTLNGRARLQDTRTLRRPFRPPFHTNVCMAVTNSDCGCKSAGPEPQHFKVLRENKEGTRCNAASIRWSLARHACAAICLVSHACAAICLFSHACAGSCFASHACAPIGLVSWHGTTGGARSVLQKQGKRWQ